MGYYSSDQRMAQYGAPIPPRKFWLALESLHDYRSAGEDWASAGKPQSGLLFDRMIEAEIAYNNHADDIWFASWTEDQRKQWSDAFTSPSYNAIAGFPELAKR